MTREEFGMFASALRTYYPRETLLPNPQAAELWFRQLQDIPFQIAEASLNKWVATNKWSPSIADIREMAASVQHGDIPDWSEAWEAVMLAIRRFGSYQEGEALASLDELTRTAVKRLGFRNICLSENITADRANFRTTYEILVNRKQKEQQISLPLRELIQGIQQKGVMQIESKGISETGGKAESAY